LYGVKTMPWKPINPDQQPQKRIGSYYRGYGKEWMKFRKRYLIALPICVKCGRASEVVDHIIPWNNDENLKFDEQNLQALCKRCHDYKTGKHDSRPLYRYPIKKNTETQIHL